MANCPAGVSCLVVYQLMICGFICLKLKPAEILKLKKSVKYMKLVWLCFVGIEAVCNFV